MNIDVKLKLRIKAIRVRHLKRKLIKQLRSLDGYLASMDCGRSMSLELPTGTRLASEVDESLYQLKRLGEPITDSMFITETYRKKEVDLI